MANPHLSTPLLLFEDVSFRFAGGRDWAIEHFSLQVAQGQTVALTGASAAGKSTVLGIACGELPHIWGGELRGKVGWTDTFAEASRHLARPNMSRIGVVLRSPRENLTGFLATVKEELAFDLHAREWSGADVDKRIAEVSAALGIRHLLERDPLTLSGGEQQRLALALAAVARPRLVVLDDPVAHLDALARGSWLSALRSTLHDKAAILFESRDGTALPNGDVSTVVVPPNREASVDQDLILLCEEPSFHGSEAALSVRCQRAGYDAANPIRFDLDFTVEPGQCVGITGPNGSGKTTLLKAIAGTLPYMDGAIRVAGTALERLPAHERCKYVAYALQDPRDQLFATTVRKEIALGPKLVQHLRGQRLDRLVERSATAMAVHHLLTRHPRELSRGETRRTGIAAALSLETPVLLLDEPTVGLDSSGLGVISDLIARHRARGGSVLVASHDEVWLSRVAQRIVSLAPATASVKTAVSIQRLLAHRQQIRQWLGKLILASTVAPENVRNKVRQDYEHRLKVITSELESHARDLAMSLNKRAEAPYPRVDQEQAGMDEALTQLWQVAVMLRQESGDADAESAGLRQVVSRLMTLRCEKCGAYNLPTEWYCDRCGAELPTS